MLRASALFIGIVEVDQQLQVAPIIDMIFQITQLRETQILPELTPTQFLDQQPQQIIDQNMPQLLSAKKMLVQTMQNGLNQKSSFY